jgi:hypothetical protein
MSRHLDDPLGSLAGLSAGVASKLRRAGLFVVGDLLRVSSSQLRSIAGARVRASDARRWRSIASLLQVEGLSPAAARTLFQSGVESIDTLHTQSFEALATVLETASRREGLARMPTPADIAAVQRDSAVISHCGAVAGTVRTSDGKPVSGVEVRCGPARVTTDRRGRFRLLRIPLRSRCHAILLQHPRFGMTVVDPAPIVPDSRAVSLTTLVLGAAGPGGSARVLRERDGDRLPPFNGLPVREERISLSDVDPRDLFMLRRLPASGTEAELLSRFRSFAAGEFIVIVCRVPRRGLPRDARAGEHFRLEQGKLARVRVSDAGMAFRRRLRQVTGVLGKRPRPRTPMEHAAALRDLSTRLRQATFDRPPDG